MKDVLTFGETMLRLSPPGFQRLDQAAAMEVWVAGSESNVAVALTALGGTATWVSRLPENALGQRIAATLAMRGVDVSSVVWAAPEERQGLFYAEAGTPPRTGSVLYDRSRSAASFLSPADLPDTLFDTHRHLHVTGITPALSPCCADTVDYAVQRAKARGRTVSLDINYRAKLWTPAAAASALLPLLPQVDVLLCGRDDAARVFGLRGEDQDRARELHERFGPPLVALTTGNAGALGCSADGCVAVPAYPITVSVDRFGSGDAFAAGFLAEFLAGAEFTDALRLGVAAAALKRTIPGDLLLATRAEVEAVRSQEGEAAWR